MSKENVTKCPLCGGTVKKFERYQECFHCGTFWTPGGARYPHGYRPEWREADGKADAAQDLSEGQS